MNSCQTHDGRKLSSSGSRRNTRTTTGILFLVMQQQTWIWGTWILKIVLIRFSLEIMTNNLLWHSKCLSTLEKVNNNYRLREFFFSMWRSRKKGRNNMISLSAVFQSFFDSGALFMPNVKRRAPIWHRWYQYNSSSWMQLDGMVWVSIEAFKNMEHYWIFQWTPRCSRSQILVV